MYLYCLIALALLCSYMASRYMYWKGQARKFQTSGYCAPYTSGFGKLAFNFLSRLLTFLSVGPVTVLDGHKSPRSGRTVYISNHQLGCDFAMLRRGAGRYFKMLTAGNELKGLVGVIGAFIGVISVLFKDKSQRHAAEEACVNAVAAENGCLGIFPEGNLLPDNPNLSEKFLPGAVRIARKASQNAGNALVQIVPMALYYERDPKKADWTDRFMSRSRWLGLRDPRNYDPIFKIDLDTLNSDERVRVEAERAQKRATYYKSHISLYGGVVVVGDPIDVATLPADLDEACKVLRDRVAELMLKAK